MKRLIIAADLGHLKAFDVSRDGSGSSPRIRSLRHDTFEGYKPRAKDRLTDSAGRFPGGAPGQGGMGYGEEHNEQLEMKKRQLKVVAESIDEVAQSEAWDEIYLASPPSMHLALFEMLSSDVREKVREHIPADLVKVPDKDLVSRFDIPAFAGK